MTKISSLSALTGAGVDTAADLVPVVDMSETGAARNKKMTFAELALALQEAFDDRMDAVLTEGDNVTITYDDGAGTITIAATPPGPGDITGFNEAVDDRVAALITAGSGITKSYNDGAGTLTLAVAGGAGGALDDLADVNAPAPADGNVLTWDSTPGEWVASAPAAAGYTPGGTDVAVADGGTGSSTASGARTNLGLAIGTDVKAQAPSVQSVTSSGTVTPTFSDDAVKITAQAAGLTLANPSGTAVPFWGWAIRIKDNGTARSIGYGTQYRAIGVTLPTTTVISKTLYLGCIWNNDDSKVDVVAVAQEA